MKLQDWLPELCLIPGAALGAAGGAGAGALAGASLSGFEGAAAGLIGCAFLGAVVGGLLGYFAGVLAALIFTAHDQAQRRVFWPLVTALVFGTAFGIWLRLHKDGNLEVALFGGLFGLMAIYLVATMIEGILMRLRGRSG
jgi:hypothetical protein